MHKPNKINKHNDQAGIVLVMFTILIVAVLFLMFATIQYLHGLRISVQNYNKAIQSASVMHQNFPYIDAAFDAATWVAKLNGFPSAVPPPICADCLDAANPNCIPASTCYPAPSNINYHSNYSSANGDIQGEIKLEYDASAVPHKMFSQYKEQVSFLSQILTGGTFGGITPLETQARMGATNDGFLLNIAFDMSFSMKGPQSAIQALQAANIPTVSTASASAAPLASNWCFPIRIDDESCNAASIGGINYVGPMISETGILTTDARYLCCEMYRSMLPFYIDLAGRPKVVYDSAAGENRDTGYTLAYPYGFENPACASSVLDPTNLNLNGCFNDYQYKYRKLYNPAFQYFPGSTLGNLAVSNPTLDVVITSSPPSGVTLGNFVNTYNVAEFAHPLTSGYDVNFPLSSGTTGLKQQQRMNRPGWGPFLYDLSKPVNYFTTPGATYFGYPFATHPQKPNYGINRSDGLTAWPWRPNPMWVTTGPNGEYTQTCAGTILGSELNPNGGCSTQYGDLAIFDSDFWRSYNKLTQAALIAYSDLSPNIKLTTFSGPTIAGNIAQTKTNGQRLSGAHVIFDSTTSSTLKHLYEEEIPLTTTPGQSFMSDIQMNTLLGAASIRPNYRLWTGVYRFQHMLAYLDKNAWPNLTKSNWFSGVAPTYDDDFIVKHAYEGSKYYMPLVHPKHPFHPPGVLTPHSKPGRCLSWQLISGSSPNALVSNRHMSRYYGGAGSGGKRYYAFTREADLQGNKGFFPSPANMELPISLVWHDSWRVQLGQGGSAGIAPWGGVYDFPALKDVNPLGDPQEGYQNGATYVQEIVQNLAPCAWNDTKPTPGGTDFLAAVESARDGCLNYRTLVGDPNAKCVNIFVTDGKPELSQCVQSQLNGTYFKTPGAAGCPATMPDGTPACTGPAPCNTGPWIGNLACNTPGGCPVTSGAICPVFTCDNSINYNSHMTSVRSALSAFETKDTFSILLFIQNEIPCPNGSNTLPSGATCQLSNIEIRDFINHFNSDCALNSENSSNPNACKRRTLLTFAFENTLSFRQQFRQALISTIYLVKSFSKYVNN